ncbi:MAG: hypothetical protein ACK452_04400, partial [Bacteroidota bacterium]
NLTQQIFSGNFIPQDKFFEVESIKYNIAFLKDGQLSGINVSDEIGLFETSVNSPKDAKPLFTGTVTSASPLSSELKLSETPSGSKTNAGMYRAFITKQANSGAEIKVKLELKKHRKELESRLGKMSNIQLVKSDYQYLVKEIDQKGAENGKVIIYVGLNENTPLREMKPMTMAGADQYDSLVTFLKEASKVELLRKLEIDDWNNIEFNVKVIDLKTKTEVPFENLKIYPGEQYGFEINNTGNSSFFLQIINIAPNYLINTIKGKDKIEIKPNSKHKSLQIKQINPPYGIEQLIFIASSNPLDLTPLENMGSKINTRGGDSQLMDFINKSSSGTRSIGQTVISEVKIKSVYFETIDKITN